MERLPVPVAGIPASYADGRCYIMPPPGFDQHAGLGEAVEDLAVEQFVAQRPVERFIVARPQTIAPPDRLLIFGRPMAIPARW